MMGSPTFKDKLLDLVYFPWRLKYWWEQTFCEHEFFHELKETGWFTTGTLDFLAECSKCGKHQRVNLTYPLETNP